MANLHFVDIKNYAIRIARKYGMSVSLVNSELTSQECSCCHYIDKENRKSQENVKCLNCGFEINADLNAACNILKKSKPNDEIISNLRDMGLTIPYRVQVRL